MDKHTRSERITVVGIDPGVERIGYAVVREINKVLELVSVETIFVARKTLPAERLAVIARELNDRLQRDRPDVVALEKLFFTKNVKTALVVAEARGIILLTAFLTVRSIWEYTPTEVKSTVTGDGRADKKQMLRMMQMLFPKTSFSGADDDAIDAAAVALTGILRKQERTEKIM